jgi:hypothetical protein
MCVYIKHLHKYLYLSIYVCLYLSIIYQSIYRAIYLAKHSKLCFPFLKTLVECDTFTVITHLIYLFSHKCNLIMKKNQLSERVLCYAKSILKRGLGKCFYSYVTFFE